MKYDSEREKKCRRCGVCCGATDGHPCEHLVLRPDGYWCEIYPYRFGPHRTVTGQSFNCVPVEQVIKRTGGPKGCAYVSEA